MPKLGEYVLATKWADGDPDDQWAVGYYAGKTQDSKRHFVVDQAGAQMSLNGFRRVARITPDEGQHLLSTESNLLLWQRLRNYRHANQVTH